MSAALLETLVRHDPIPALLGDAAEWRRSYGRTDGNGCATLLYERAVQPCEIASIRIGGEGVMHVRGLGEILVGGWRDDPELPQLREIADRRPGIVPIRYRPGKRMTFRLGRPRDVYLKALADDRGEAIIRDARLLWNAMTAGELGFGVARPAAWLPGQRILAMHAIDAEPVAEAIFAKTGAMLAHRMGRANASLASSNLRPAAQYDYGWQMRRSSKYAKRIVKRLPQAERVLREVLNDLGHVPAGRADRPIHGAPHLHQWLARGDSLYLVDFDRFGFGDPELDAATFVAEMEFERDPEAAAIARAYEEGFSAGHLLNARLFAAYRVHEHIAKALRVLSSIRLDAEACCMAVLHSALRQSRKLA